MNIRKNIDYGDMYAAIDKAMARDIPQMELYCEIGKAVCTRIEKGAAVAAAEYLKSRYPDVRGFSPRNLRRMRDFYRMYENEPTLLALAMELNWTHNVVIMEADLTMVEREWYLKITQQFKWSKYVLMEKVTARVHEKMTQDVEQGTCYKKNKVKMRRMIYSVKYMLYSFKKIINKHRCNGKLTIERSQSCTLGLQLFAWMRNNIIIILNPKPGW